MLKKYSLLALLLASSISLPVFATDQISFSVAHDGLTSGIVESVLLKTLTNRRWNIVNNNHEEINVSLHSHGKEANLRLLFNEKKVTIISNSYCPQAPKFPDYKVTKIPCYPKRWINNIKKDTLTFLSRQNLAVTNDTTPKLTIKQRLVKLQALHKEGLISTVQYENKQKNLLKEL